MARYSHRNGETEPPTIAGWFGYEDTREVGNWYRAHGCVLLGMIRGQLCERQSGGPVDGNTWTRWWGPWEPWAEDESHAE